jgi:hypothetical protein
MGNESPCPSVLPSTENGLGIDELKAALKTALADASRAALNGGEDPYAVNSRAVVTNEEALRVYSEETDEAPEEL